MGVDGMSGDESEHYAGAKHYIVYQDEWRSREVIDWIRPFDQIYLATKFNHLKRARRGNWPRTREVSTLQVTRAGTPVVGLPRNFYDEGWLSKLDEFEVDELQIKPEVDLTHTAAFLRYLPFHFIFWDFFLTLHTGKLNGTAALRVRTLYLPTLISLNPID
jgi:hypothetical protein